MGERPLLDEADVLQSLRTDTGRLRPEHRVGPRLPLTTRSSVSFATYAALELEMLESLAQGELPLTVLGTDAELPALRRDRWHDVAARWVASATSARRSSHALLWFGSAVLAIESGRELQLGERPWEQSFSSAEARSPEGDARAILADWLADAIWGLEWSTACAFDVARADFTARLMVADTITRSLVAGGARPDRAAAEAVLVIELATLLPGWHEVVSKMTPAD